MLTAALACLGACASDPPQAGLIARIERPTADGRASYIFEFVEAGGAVSTAIGMPAGYPAVQPEACALDTYLRVADADALVPAALLRACDRDVRDVRVRELRAADGEFRPPVASAGATGPFCTKSAYDDRFKDLSNAASKVAKHSVSYNVCDYTFLTDGVSTCALYDADTGDLAGTCYVDQIPTEIPLDVPDNCFAWHGALRSEPNPACKHDIVAKDPWGPWLDWEWNTPFGTSRVQAEASVCATNSTTVFFWQMRRKDGGAWTTPVYQLLYGGAYWIFTLDAGSSHGDWSGAQFRVHANGEGVYPMLVGAIMEGIDRTDCPTGLFL